MPTSIPATSTVKFCEKLQTLSSTYILLTTANFIRTFRLQKFVPYSYLTEERLCLCLTALSTNAILCTPRTDY
jgi:hypothetical protein